MAQVILRAPLSELCGGRSHVIAGATVGEVLIALEGAHPPSPAGCSTSRGASASTSTSSSTAEPGRGGHRSARPIASTSSPRSQEDDDDRTARGHEEGPVPLEGDGGGFEITARAFAGQSVEYAMRDPRSGRYLAAVTSWFYGPSIWVTDDPTGEWEQAEGSALPEGGEQALERLWVIVPGEADGSLYAGGDPGALFESRDGGLTWSLNRGLWDHPTRPDWSPATAACACTRSPLAGRPVAPPRRDLGRRRLALRRRRRDVAHSNAGIVPDYMPEEARDNPIQHCVHDMRRAPAQPERLFMQFHGGVYRSDDAGASWIDIGEGLPSDFGFPIVVDPADADSAYVIPLIGAEDRTPPDGAVRVWETRDAGATWTARGDGLPDTRVPDGAA